MVVAISHVKMDCGKQHKNNKASLPRGGGIEQRKSVFGKYSDSDMLSLMKGLALDPCSSGLSRNSIRPLWNQNLKLREFMTLTNGDSDDCPGRKRKLEQFVKDNSVAARGLTLEVFSRQSVTKQRRKQLSQASSSSVVNSTDSNKRVNKKSFLGSSCSESLLTFADNFQEKQVPTKFSHLDNVADHGPPDKPICSAVESDESANGLNPENSRYLALHNPTSLDLDDSVHSSNSSSSEDPKQVPPQAPRRSMRLLNFIGDHLQRMVIPIGRHFQADVPEWGSPANKENLKGNDVYCENSRWLGTRIWPLECITVETNARAVGKGRPNSCHCVFAGSIDCTKLHILEERFSLHSELGPAFLSWKFDEMGEEVSKSWTLKEQESFELLAKIYPPSNRNSFLKHALKCFPSKSKGNILSYYLNVFIPRRISQLTRLSSTEIDSGGDEVEGEGIDHTDL